MSQSQICSSSEHAKDLPESSQAIFDDFQKDRKTNIYNSTFRNSQDARNEKVVLVTGENFKIIQTLNYVLFLNII